MMFADIHTHRTLISEGELAVRSLDFSQAKEILSITGKNLYSVGVHPWNIGELRDNWLVDFVELCEDSRIVLIGECGLDKNTAASVELQTDVFEKQIHISEKMRKPLIIHCVGFFNELIGLRKKHKPSQKWILHGFRGKPQLAEQLLKAGFDISFGEKMNAESVKIVPVEHLFVETDESEIPISEIYSQIARIKGNQPDELRMGYELISEFTGLK